PSLLSIGNSGIVSNLAIAGNVSVGYLPLANSSLLTSGFSKSYWLQSSANVIGLPISFGYSSASSITVSPASFSFHQGNISFNCQQFLENLKSQAINVLTNQLQNEEQKILAYHFTDSLAEYERLRDTLASLSYQAHIQNLQDSTAQLIAQMK